MSGARRFFADGVSLGGECLLTGEEFEHARTVLRVREGDEVILLSGDGKEYSSIVTSVGKKEIALHVVSSQPCDKEPRTEIALYFGFLKNADKNEFAVQKAVELGVSRIVLFASDYSSAFLSENKAERLQKVAREAAKQCLRAVSPKIEVLSSFDEVISDAKRYGKRLFACEFADKSDEPLSALNEEKATSGVCVIVGSEGGFSEREAEKARENGCSFVSLGKRILRAETAATALLSVVAYQVGELR